MALAPARARVRLHTSGLPELITVFIIITAFTSSILDAPARRPSLHVHPSAAPRCARHLAVHNPRPQAVPKTSRHPHTFAASQKAKSRPRRHTSCK